MKIDAQFVASASAVAECPQWDRIEVAIAGRSNVGKSSLINSLTGVKGLARSSKMPGRTRALNFFTMGDELGLVDMPGYGYAKMSHQEAARMAPMMSQYLEQRRNLAAVLILIDARRGPQREESSLAGMIRSRNLELLFAATKSDKLKNSERAAAARRFAAIGVQPIWCSATDGEGLDALRRRLFRLARPAGDPRAAEPR